MMAPLRGKFEPTLTRDVLNTMGAADVRAIAIKAGVAEHASTATCIDRLVSLQRQVARSKQGSPSQAGPKVQGWTKRRIIQNLTWCAPRISLAELQQVAPFMQRYLPDIYRRELDLAHEELSQQIVRSRGGDEHSGTIEHDTPFPLKVDTTDVAEAAPDECCEHLAQQASVLVSASDAAAEPAPQTESDARVGRDCAQPIATVCYDTFQVPFDHIFTGPADHYPSTIRIQMGKKGRGGAETYWTFIMAGRRGLRCRTRREVQYDSEDEARDAFLVMHEALQACGMTLTHAATCQSEVMDSVVID